jgi:hypothetical protein
MAGMELLQFHTLLYSALEEVSAECDVAAALPRKQNRPYLLVVGLGMAQGSSGEFGKGKIFYLLPRFIARLLGCPAFILVTVLTELSAVTYISLFLDCHKCF